MTEELLTYRDAYESLLDTFNLVGKDQDRTIRNLRRAIVDGYRKLPVLHNWRYFIRTSMIHTTAEYSTGTIAYSTSTNQVTLTSGTWPADAEFSHLIVSDKQYKVARRISDTVLELDTNSKPSADITAGTSYRLGRFRYLLPIDVGDIREVINSEQLMRLKQCDPSDLFWRNSALNTETYPTAWTMVRSEDYPGRWELWLSSVDTSIRELKILYSARTTSLPIEEISSGTVSVSDDTATFSASVLTEDCVGCVLRISSTSNKPTPRVGSWIDDQTGHVTRLPDYERVITKYTNATTAVLNREISAGVTTKGYSLSSHVDVNPSGMWELFLRLCEEQYDIITRADPEKIRQSQGLSMIALRNAMVADSRRIEPVDSHDYAVSPIVSNESVT